MEKTMFNVGDKIKIVRRHQYKLMKSEIEATRLAKEEFDIAVKAVKEVFERTKERQPHPVLRDTTPIIREHGKGTVAKNDIGFIDRVGLIEKIRLEPGCAYEEETGNIACYLVKFIGGGASWDGKHLHFFPDELEFVSGATPEQLELLASSHSGAWKKDLTEEQLLKKRQKDKYQK